MAQLRDTGAGDSFCNHGYFQRVGRYFAGVLGKHIEGQARTAQRQKVKRCIYNLETGSIRALSFLGEKVMLAH